MKIRGRSKRKNQTKNRHQNRHTYVWKDVVLINGKYFAESFPISGKRDDVDVYQIDDFYDAVAKKHNVNSDDIMTHMMDNITFDPQKLAFGAETCGLYIDGMLT